MAFNYPSARRSDTVDIYHGTKIQDPYRWMEDPDCEEVKEFICQQNNIAIPYLDCCPVREMLRDKITQRWNYPKYSCPVKEGDFYYFFMNTGLQNQSVMYQLKDLSSEQDVFIDPNELSKEGLICITYHEFSEDGKYVAYGLSEKGSDWNIIKIREAATKTDLPDVIEKVRYSSIAWTHDNMGFFYSAYPDVEGKSDGTETTVNLNQKLYYHKLNTSQSEDVVCAEYPDHPGWKVGAAVSFCGRYVLLFVKETCRNNMLYYSDLKSLPGGITGLLPMTCIADNFDAEYEYITNDGPIFTIQTNKNAPLYRVVKINFEDPGEDKWVNLIPENPKQVLEWAMSVDANKLLVCYLEDVKNVLNLYDFDTGVLLRNFPLDIGTVTACTGKRRQSEIFYRFSSFLTPGCIYYCDINDKSEPKIFRKMEVVDFDESKFTTIQVFYPSKDGTKIPMFIVYPKTMIRDGSTPALLYGYGGFNINVHPVFSVARIVFMQHFGGIIAIPNIRGGGEYGEEWHNAGRLLNKQNVFDDFIAAAEYLIANDYTSREKLTINGASNGGLLVGACVNQRPDLFGCAIAQVGVMDMLRFHKFTIGHAWVCDYGSSDDKEQFEYLLRYSPLHNVKPPVDENVQYPAVLLFTADHDDRVVPLHSLKFIAELQYKIGKCPQQANPLLIRVDVESGHGGGKPTSKVIEEWTDMFSFMYKALALEFKE